MKPQSTRAVPRLSLLGEQGADVSRELTCDIKPLGIIVLTTKYILAKLASVKKVKAGNYRLGGLVVTRRCNRILPPPYRVSKGGGGYFFPRKLYFRSV